MIFIISRCLIKITSHFISTNPGSRIILTINDNMMGNFIPAIWSSFLWNLLNIALSFSWFTVQVCIRSIRVEAGGQLERVGFFPFYHVILNNQTQSDLIANTFTEWAILPTLALTFERLHRLYPLFLLYVVTVKGARGARRSPPLLASMRSDLLLGQKTGVWLTSKQGMLAKDMVAPP